MSTTVRQVKCLNYVVVQDNWAIKRVAWPVYGFKSFRSVRNNLAGIEFMRMEGIDLVSFAD